MSQELIQSGGQSNSQLRVDSGRLTGKGDKPIDDPAPAMGKDNLPVIMKDGKVYKNTL